jgi:ABC-type uncharacterized transport system involved in gliding motility auxiliary subunit
MKPSLWMGLSGGALLLVWAALMLIFAPPAWAIWTTGLAGTALTAAYAVLERASLKRTILSPRLRYGGNAMAFTVIVAVIVILLNVITSRHSWRADLTSNKFYSLSDQTRKILKGLKREVKVTAFLKTGSPEAAQISDLLDQYKHAGTKLAVETLDSDRTPAKAMIYKISQQNTLVLESGGKRKDILPHELFGYQFQGQQPQQEFKGEPVITSAILSVSQDGQLTVYFLEGHGERSMDDASENGVLELKKGLERDNYLVKTINLMKDGKIPADARVLVLAGPRKNIPADERKLIGSWLENDGRAIVLFEPESTGGLEDILRPWGVNILGAMVADPRSYFVFAGPLVPIPTYRPHRITDDLRKQGVGIMMPGARALEAGKYENGTVATLLETTAESWIESDWQSKDGKVKFDAGKDRKGAFALGLAVTRNALSTTAIADPSQTAPGPSPRLVVYGNAAWVTNGVKANSEANFDLFANSVNWLAGNDQTISIRPKETVQRRIFLDSVKARLMWWLTVILTPLAVVAVGVFRWWRQRSL